MTTTTVSRGGRGLACGFLALFALTPRAEASTHIWTGAGSNALWSNAANWSGGKPTSNEPDWTTVQFGSNTTSTCDISGLVVDVIHFTGGNNLITGTTPLRINGDNAPVNVISATGNNKIGSSLPLVFVVFTPFMEVDAGYLSLAASCSGTPGFRKTGAGTLELAGNNSYKGTTEIAAGVVTMLATSPDVGVPGNLTVGLGTGAAGSATLLDVHGGIADTSKVTVGSDGYLRVDGSTETIAALTIHDGKVDVNSDELKINQGGLNMTGGVIGLIGGGAKVPLRFIGASTLTATSSAATGPATIALPVSIGGNLTCDIAAGPSQPELLVKGEISETAGLSQLVKKGAGEMRLASGTVPADSTYTGDTLVQKGTLSLNASSKIAIPGNLYSGDMNDGALPAGTAVVKLLADSQIADTATVHVYKDGVLDFSGGGDAINGLVLDGGTVAMGHEGFVVGIAGLVTSGGTITAQEDSGPLYLNGPVTMFYNADTGRNLVIAPAVFVQQAVDFAVYANDPAVPALVLSGFVSDLSHDYGFTKEGTGTMILTEDNDLTGPTQIRSGEVVVNGVQGSSQVMVSAGGAVGGSGVIGRLTTAFDPTAEILPGGTDAPGALRVNGDANIQGATLRVRLDDNHTAQKCDLLKVSGSLQISGATLAPLPVGAFSAGPYVIASYGDFGGTLSGTFSHIPPGYSVDYAYNNGTSTRNIAVTVTNPYFIWAANYGLDPATTAVFNADPDHDGLENGMEFVLGTSPLATTGGPGLPLAAVVGTDFVFTYRRNESAVYLNPVLEVSSTLAAGSWTTVTTGIVVAQNFYGGGVDKVTVTIPMAGRTRLFGRVSVDAP